MDYIRAIERQQIREDIPAVKVGDHVKVHYRIVEGDRTREQVFEGDVIRMSGAGRQALLPPRPRRQGRPHSREARLASTQARQSRPARGGFLVWG